MTQNQPATATRNPYAQITLDWTFKRIFASDTSDRLLVSLINTLLKRQLLAPVVHAELTQTVELGITENNRGAIFDLQCKDKEGRYFSACATPPWLRNLEGKARRLKSLPSTT
jgi:hypothetical protein